MKYLLKIETEMNEVITYSISDLNSVLEKVSEWLLTSESGETPIYSLEITPEF